MARVVGTVKWPAQDYGKGFQASWEREKAALAELEKVSEEVVRGDGTSVVGYLWATPRGDGMAIYRVKSESPLTLEHVPYGDAWDALAETIRGLRLSDIRREIDFERSWKSDGKLKPKQWPIASRPSDASRVGPDNIKVGDKVRFIHVSPKYLVGAVVEVTKVNDKSAGVRFPEDAKLRRYSGVQTRAPWTTIEKVTT